MDNLLLNEAIIAQELPVNDQDYAFIIGVEHYQNLIPLQAPISDACALRSWLISAGGGNMRPENCVLISSTGAFTVPEQRYIDTELFNLLKRAGEGTPRRLYFYFSGHGFGATLDNNAMCLPFWSEILLNEALSSEEYVDLLVKFDVFEEIYFFLDCCRDTRPSARPSHPKFAAPLLCSGKSMAMVLYASQYDNPAWESIGASNGNLSAHGFFSQALIEALEGAAVNKQGNITIDSLISCVKQKTETYADEKKRTQTVRSEIRNNRYDLQHVLYQRNRPSGTPLSIHFNDAGHIKLHGPDSAVIKEGEVEAGENWELVLNKGFHQIYETRSQRNAFITIDGSPKPFTYEFV